MKVRDIIKFIEKELQKHKKAEIFEDEPCTDCPIIEQQMTRVASRKEWLGDNKSWEEAKKHEEFMDKNISCQFCDFCKELKKKIIILEYK
ncbi:MAG: hypothetical protein KKB31_05890 [Nanoarchaeota archaeon]|nr:hypothetical protein [Nanoarchaeota archaeon]